MPCNRIRAVCSIAPAVSVSALSSFLMEITIVFIGEMEATFTAGRFQDRARSADMTSLEVTGITGDYREYESDCDYFQKILDQPALAEMRDLAALAQRVFQTQIAFLAM